MGRAEMRVLTNLLSASMMGVSFLAVWMFSYVPMLRSPMLFSKDAGRGNSWIWRTENWGYKVITDSVSWFSI